jgi:hypothetical protein
MAETPQRASIEQLLESISHLSTDEDRQSALSKLAAMQRWFVIDLGARDRILPMILEEEEDFPGVCLFTSGDTAMRMVKMSSDLPETARVTSMPIHEAPEFLTSMRSWGVQKAVFNPGPFPFECPMDDVVIATWNSRPESLPDIDTVVAKARQISDQASPDQLWSAIVELPQWYFIADPAMPMDPMVGICRDQPCALAFTDPVRARRYAEMIDPSCTVEGSRLIALSPGQAQWWFRTLAARGIAGAIFNDGPFAFYTPVEQMTATTEAVRSVA